MIVYVTNNKEPWTLEPSPDANKSRVVGHLNILSLLASFAREISLIRTWNTLHSCVKYASFACEIRFIRAWNTLHSHVKYASFAREIRFIRAWNTLHSRVKYASFAREIRFIRAWNTLHSCVKYASFAREIRFIRAWNTLHSCVKFTTQQTWICIIGGASAASYSLVAKFIPVSIKVRSSIVQLWVSTYNQINLSSIVVSDFLPPLVITSLLEQAPDWLTRCKYPPKFRFFNSRDSLNSRRLIRANSAAGLSIASLHWLNM